MYSVPVLPTPAVACAGMLNSLLRHEAWAADRLARHAGKTARLTMATRSLSLSIQSTGLFQVSGPEIVPDITLTLPPGRLPELFSALQSRDETALTALFHIEGDAGLAQLVSELVRDLRWDIEQALAARVGDAAALRLLGGARRLFSGGREAARRLGENASEYLAEEARILVSQPPFQEWSRQVQSLHERLSALERRVATFDHRTVKPAGHPPSC